MTHSDSKNVFQNNTELQSSNQRTRRSTDRLFSLDLLKAVSIVTVVSYHGIFVPRSTYSNDLQTLDVLSGSLRFCVPVLFTISFVLLERSFAHTAQSAKTLVKKRLFRLLIPTLFWFGLAIALKLVRRENPIDILGATINGDIFRGAYYLLVLFQFIPIVALVRRWLKYPQVILLILISQIAIFCLISQIASGRFASSALLPVLQQIGRPLFIYWLFYPALGVYFWRHWSSLVQLSKGIELCSEVVYGQRRKKGRILLDKQRPDEDTP